MTFTAKSSAITHPSIDDIDAAGTPSLVAYWKCDEGAGTVLHDSSGNDYHLDIACHASKVTDGGRAGGSCAVPEGETFEGNLAKCWDSFKGYFTPYSGIGALIDVAGTGLDTGSKYVVFGGEQIFDGVNNGDFDCGTYWAGEYGTPPPNAFPQQLGFNWALSILQHWFRLAWDNGAGESYSSVITDVDCGEGQFTANKPTGFSGAFLPSTSFKGCMGDNEKVVTVTTSQYLNGIADTTGIIPASLSAQDGKFGLRGQDRMLAGSWKPSSAVRNFYVWAFNNEPPMLEAGLQYLAKNPDKIPPWWIGR